MPSNHQKKLGGSLPKEIRKPAIILGIEVGLLGAIERNLVEEKLEALLKHYGIPANKPSKWHALCVHLLGELELLKTGEFRYRTGPTPQELLGSRQSNRRNQIIEAMQYFSRY